LAGSLLYFANLIIEAEKQASLRSFFEKSSALGKPTALPIMERKSWPTDHKPSVLKTLPLTPLFAGLSRSTPLLNPLVSGSTHIFSFFLITKSCDFLVSC
jgi:hypothetical protein